MPAYRSDAEAKIRTAIVDRLRQMRPDARIIHEINVSTYGPNRIDVMAVSPDTIIAVEIKSEKDKLDRLPAQMLAMKGCAHHAIAAIHETFLVERETNAGAAQYERDGKHYMLALPDVVGHDIAWVFPEAPRALDSDYDWLFPWRMPQRLVGVTLPHCSLDLLWRDELAWLCARLRIAAGRRSTMSEMVTALRWHCNGQELTGGICAALRMRRCVEADPEIAEAA